MKVIMAELSESELERRKQILAAEKSGKPKPRRHGKGKVRFVGKLDDYSGMKLKGLPRTFVGKMDKVCPSCDHPGMTKWRRQGRIVALCPCCGRTEDKGRDYWREGGKR